MDLKTIIEIAVSIGSALGLGTWLKSAYKKYKIAREARHKELYNMLKDQDEQLKLIKHQVFPNGGKSMNDSVKQIANKIEELIESQRNTRDLMDVASFESDSLGRFTFVSASFCELIGCLPTNALGMSWINRIHTSEQSKRIFVEWKHAVKNAGDFEETITFERSDGMLQVVKTFVIHNKDQDGNVKNSLGRLIPVMGPFHPHNN